MTLPLRRLAALLAVLAVVALSAAHAALPLAAGAGAPPAAHERSAPCPHDPAPSGPASLPHGAGGPMCPLLGLPVTSSPAGKPTATGGWSKPPLRRVTEIAVFPGEHPPRPM